ncbi:MAG: outer membrane lipoprotein carrier protein LolA [Acidobacteriota bacterium]
MLAGLAYGGQADDGDWLRRLQERFDATRSFRARFVQEYVPQGFSRPQREGGVVTFRRPGRIRWEYEWPERKLAVCDGTRVWIYYPQEQRAEVEPLAAFDDGAPAVQILLGRWKLWERFRLTALERHGAELTLHLEPTPELSYLSEVRLSVASADLTLRALEAVEPGGNVLRYLFEDWQEGIDAPEELFRFQPPAGTRLEGQP